MTQDLAQLIRQVVQTTEQVSASSDLREEIDVIHCYSRTHML